MVFLVSGFFFVWGREGSCFHECLPIHTYAAEYGVINVHVVISPIVAVSYNLIFAAYM